MSVDISSSPYQFSTLWFNDAVKGIWRELLLQLQPSRVLEIGSFEGASACFVIQQVGAERTLEMHCVDTWQGATSISRVRQRPLT
jgi:cephalosporin hydroxylase